MRMLADAAEEQTWKRFLASEDETVALKAFLRAVEYKRGKPIQPTSSVSGETQMEWGALPFAQTEPRNANQPN